MKKQLLKSFQAHPSRSMGPHVRQVIPSAIAHVDPFVFLDHFGPIEKQPGAQGVPPHPHAGISTITYLFSGSNRHQDSYGHDQVINAGDLAWMQAGKGIIHAEGMNENRTTAEQIHGLQFWISLPASLKFSEPDFFYYPAADLPSFKIGQATIKVLSGEINGYRSPVKSLSPAYLYEVKIPAQQTLELPIGAGNSCGLYLISGNVSADDHLLHPTTISAFDEPGEILRLTAETDSHFMLFGGKPLNEPIVGYASYVMNSEAQIEQVMRDYVAGRMGTLHIS